MTDFPKVHIREQITRKAEQELRSFLWDLHKREDLGLTNIEYKMLLHSILSEEVSRYFKYELRMERHGNYDKPSGLME